MPCPLITGMEWNSFSRKEVGAIQDIHARHPVQALFLAVKPGDRSGPLGPVGSDRAQRATCFTPDSFSAWTMASPALSW